MYYVYLRISPLEQVAVIEQFKYQDLYWIIFLPITQIINQQSRFSDASASITIMTIHNAFTIQKSLPSFLTQSQLVYNDYNGCRNYQGNEIFV